jgi:hypothetical protein
VYGPVCVEVQPGVWDCLPSLPSWACVRLVHDDAYLVRLRDRPATRRSGELLAGCVFVSLHMFARVCVCA